MRKFLLPVLALGLVFSTGIARAGQPVLNLFIWSAYIPDDLITGFEKQCGCKVIQTNYDSNAELEAKLRAGGDSEYDVVVPSSYYVPELTDEGLLQPLDHAKLTNFGNLFPRFQNPDYDVNDKYSVPYQWGMTGVVYDPAKLANPGDGWGILFDPKVNPKFPFVLPKGEGRDQISAACAYLGYGFNCATEAQWLTAAKLILETKKRPNFAGFVDETPARDQMKSGLIAAAMAYSGDIFQCYADSSCKTLKFYLPSEGAEIWVDTMAIPTHAPNPQLATAFINYILDAKNGADLSESNQYASPNQASAPYLKDIMSSPLINPPADVMKRLVFLAPLRGAKFKLFNQIWTSVLQ
jgi:spermidine/putrescine transport system substrate-binding protein